jgi:glycosyltransferase involved in cell wall biosynthesis
MNSLLVLAFNEEKNIEAIINELKDFFVEIIVINDASTDSTEDILNKIKKNNTNLVIINNKKNLGAGKSFSKGIDYFINSDSEFLIKVDGDKQFFKDDILNIKELLNTKNLDFIKCDRFWEGGIVGKIPNVRYFGNAFASLLIKFVTGSFILSDPLNGLVGFNKKVLLNFNLPKIFYRYGYPFYLTSYMSKLVIIENIRVGQYKNKVKYYGKKKTLNPLLMFVKLIIYSIKEYIARIKLKLMYSKYQTSALLDIASLFSLIALIYSITKYFYIKYLFSNEPYGTWIGFAVISLIMYSFLLVRSKSIENKIVKENYIEL